MRSPFGIELLLPRPRSRYTSDDFRSLLKTLTIQQSMSGQRESAGTTPWQSTFGKLKGRSTEHGTTRPGGSPLSIQC